MAKTKKVTVNGQEFELQSVSPSWYYDFNDECGNTGSGKRKSAKYMDGMFKNCVISPPEVKAQGMEYFDEKEDLKTPEQQAELANVVRFAIDRSRLTQEHLDYVIAAVKALYEDRESIPNMRIVWGHNLPMRHFHAFLEPYPNEEK